MILVHCNHRKIGDSWVRVLSNEFGGENVVLSSEVNDDSLIEVAVCWKAPDRMFHRFPNLKLIQSMGAGVDHIFDKDNNVPNAQIARIVDPQLSEDMYEFVLSIMLNDMKRLTTYRDQQKENLWKERSYRSIAEINVGILGLGVIGQLVASKLSKLGFNVMGWSQSEKQIEQVKSFVGEDGLDTMLGQSDYLVNILPLTNATRSFINYPLLKKLKEGAYLINVGRGPHVVDEDLVRAIDDGLISGASLDVFHLEPLDKDHPYWSHPKVFLTPHIASITNIKTARQQVFENIKRFQAGEPLINKVSDVKGY